MAKNIVLDTHKKEDRRAALGTLVGTAVEWYDFFIYSNAAALVLTPLFFEPFAKSQGELAGRLLAFATVGISFFFRPLGAAVAGHFGDRIGRKGMLVLTLTLMGGATFLIGFLPTYDSIGMAAPILLILLRILQGFAAGGEWGGAALMAVEHAPAEKRGLFGGFPQIGVPLGMLMATAVLAITNVFVSQEQFVSWGWRVPFLLSFVLIVIGMWIRMGVSESPVMQEIAQDDAQVRLPMVEMFRTSSKPLVQGMLIFAGNGVAGYMITGGYILSYATKDLGLERGPLLNVITGAAAVWAISTMFSAWLSDKITRKATYILGFILQIVMVFVLFKLVDTKDYTMITVGMLLFTIPIGFTYGPQAALFAEMFPAKIRYSGAGLAYAFGAILGGAFAPFVAVYLQGKFGTSMAVALYVVTVTTIGLIAMLTVKDRTGAPLNEEADPEANRKIEEAAATPGTIHTTFERGAGF